MPVTILDPNLRAGWEPDTPVSDSILRRFLINWTASIEAHGVPLGGRCLRRDDVAAVDVGRPAGGENTATLLAPLYPDSVKEVMSALDAFYGFANGSTSGTVYLFSPWPTPNLRPYGWTLSDHPLFMLRSPGGKLPPPPKGLRIQEVGDQKALEACEVAIVRGFPLPAVEVRGPGAAFSPRLLADERVRLWVGWQGGKPVSAAVAFVAAGIVDVTLVATVPEARRQGFGTALTWRATLADPTLPALLLATAEGRHVYEQIGFLSLFRFTLWSHDRPGGAS
jgi:hypothetical protein